MPTWFQTTQIARPEFYDRKPVMTLAQYNAGSIAPHGAVTRAQITIATGFKAWLDSVFASITRQAVAGAPGLVRSHVLYSIGGGVHTVMWRLDYVSNVVGFEAHDNFPTLGFMNTGDILSLQTQDNSTGGFMDYFFGMKVTTFVE